jgi:hypothetical protein
VFFEGFECLLEVGDEVISSFRLNYYVINVSPNIVAYLIFEAILDGPLICRTSVFEFKGQGGVIVGTERRDEGCFDLVLL